MNHLKKILLAALMVVCFSSVSIASIVVNTDNGYEDYYPTNNKGKITGPLTAYAYYANSGTFLILQKGNNEGVFLASVQKELNSIKGFGNVTITEASSIFTYTNYDDASGTWKVKQSSDVIDFYIVKAANAYAMYLVNPACNIGSWSTYDLWKAGYGGKGALDISHVTGYIDPPHAAPIPASVWLLGSGLLGLAGSRRKLHK